MLIQALFLSLVIISNSQDLYRLELYSQSKGASCLDGSPPGLYIHEGTTNKDKFMIYFDSGGFCAGSTLQETLQACYKRSFTSLGTTKKSTPLKDFAKHGLLSPLKEENPLFYDWTKIFVIYCDGSEYLGHREQPIQYKDTKLYFRGTKNALQTFSYLNQKYNLYNQNKIVITGVSAGGMATFQWSNYLLDNAQKAQVFAIPDSGFFITDYYSPIVGAKVLRMYAQSLLNLVYNQSYIPEPIKKCLENKQFDIVDCLNSGNYAQYLRAPMFLIQSPYDQFSLQNILVVSCLKNTKPPYSLLNCNETTRTAIEEYRKASIKYLLKFKQSRKNIGAWSPACVQHGFSDVPSFNNDSFQVNGIKLFEAIKMFLQSPQSPPWLMDEEPWPSNSKCSGQSTQKMLKIN